MKTLIVSGNRPTNQPRDRQGHLLSCCGQLKMDICEIQMHLVSTALQGPPDPRSQCDIDSIRGSIGGWAKCAHYSRKSTAFMFNPNPPVPMLLGRVITLLEQQTNIIHNSCSTESRQEEGGKFSAHNLPALSYLFVIEPT